MIRYVIRLFSVAWRHAGAQCIPSHIVTGNAITGWNDHVKQAREQSLLWHFIWQQSGRPNHGHIYHIMRTTRHRYHYSVRWFKKNKQQIQRTKLAENITNSDTFWGELRKINPVSKQISETIGTAQGSSEICKLFFHTYKSLYNSVPTSDSEMPEVCDALHDNLLTCDESLIHRVTPDI